MGAWCSDLERQETLLCLEADVCCKSGTPFLCCGCCAFRCVQPTVCCKSQSQLLGPVCIIICQFLVAAQVAISTFPLWCTVRPVRSVRFSRNKTHGPTIRSLDSWGSFAALQDLLYHRTAQCPACSMCASSAFSPKLVAAWSWGTWRAKDGCEVDQPWPKRRGTPWRLHDA